MQAPPHVEDPASLKALFPSLGAQPLLPPLQSLNLFTPLEQTLRRQEGPPRTPSITNKDPTRVIPPAALAAGAQALGPDETKEVLNLSNIQGDVLVGFNKPYFVSVFLQIANKTAVVNWLSTNVRPNITSCIDVMAFRDQFRKARFAQGAKVKALTALRSLGIQQACMNVSISYQGLVKLVGATEAQKFSDLDFQNDLLGSAGSFGDPNPSTWVVGNANTRTDILIQIGADTVELAQQLRNTVLGSAATPPGGAGILINIYETSGFRDPTLPGHEQFGFLDGIGQPSFRGVYVDGQNNPAYFSSRTISNADPSFNSFSYPGLNLVWPGEFIFGHTTPDPLNPSNPAQPMMPQAPRNAYGGGSAVFWGTFPSWAKDGTLMAYRRLRQDVPMFWNFVKSQAANKTNFPLGISDDELASRLVGRWPSGAPLMRSLNADTPAMGDEPLSNSNFFYQAPKTPTPLVSLGGKPDPFPVAPGDPLGFTCPFSGHIRKVQPRDSFDENPLLHRIIRRGSPYGEFIADRYTPDDVDRGLLFVCYNASIQQGVRFLQSSWANSAASPKPGGHDMIMGQPAGARQFTLQVPVDQKGNTQAVNLSTDLRWVIPTGGGFFFVPPIDFFAPGSILYTNTGN